MPSLFLRDYRTTGQLNYPDLRDQDSNSGILKIFYKCWAYLPVHRSLAPEINGRNNSQKTRISVSQVLYLTALGVQ